jgi:ankyrin repeat protein
MVPFSGKSMADDLRTLAFDGDIDGLKRAIADGADPNGTDGRERTALHVAAERDQPEAVSVLAAGGAEVDRKDGSGFTPLHLAVAHGSSRAVGALLEAGADPNLTTRHGFSPLTKLLSDHAKRAVQDDAVSARVVDAIRHLSVAGATADVPDADGVTALMYAALAGSTPLVAALLDGGAAATYADDYGFTPLHLAATSGNAELVSLLVDAGAARDAKTADEWEGIKAGQTPLDVARERGHSAIVALLG